ncbi:MerR family transcriptional regulator [Nonomuraea sp. NPDC046802]|uniref:MerR family transcriptional regulator n=1 Tax=Nonomuraea sp. NPDC046802 TaxID=3154919 RepID=UPI0033BFF8A3
MEEDLLPIGQFARLGRLSVKQLRHYDELGLLRPAYVDAETGYRYYRASQARTALSIGLLRSLDVPLAVIGEVLAGSPQALEAVRDGLEAELARRRRTLASLERVMAEGLPSARVRVVREPPRRAAVVRERADGLQDVSRATSAAAARLVDAWQGAPLELIGLFPVDVDEAFEVEVAAVLETGPAPAGQVRVLPGGAFACATHVGPYEQMSLTAHAVLAWCAERRLPARGRLREVYVSDPAVTCPDALVTHVMVALEEES